jgi:hypothetical protein
VRRLLVAPIAALAIATMLAASAQAAAPSPPFNQCPVVGSDASCALLIYVDANGQTGIAGDPSQGPYDNIEDTLIGVQNNSGFSIRSIPLAATTGKPLFGFDGDGVCTYGLTGCPFGTTGYEGPNVSFSSISADTTSGSVDFNPAIPPGGHAYFSLEESLSTVPPFDFDPGKPVPSGRKLVALGDSFSSGEGNPAFLPGTATNDDNCHRSALAFPELLAVDVTLHITSHESRACSGATRHDVVYGFQTEDSQLNHLDRQTRLVTVSVGGDDLEFGQVLKDCVTGALVRILRTHGNANCQNMPATDPGTGKQTTLDQREQSLISDLSRDSNSYCYTPNGYFPCRRRLAGLYADIAAASAPDVRIFVLLYPHLFTNDPADGGCDVGSLSKVSAANVRWLNDGVDKADKAILDEVNVAKAAGVNVTPVDPRPLFAKHGICANDPWIYGIKLRGDSPVPYSFHPNLKGQQGFETVMAAAIGPS